MMVSVLHGFNIFMATVAVSLILSGRVIAQPVFAASSFWYQAPPTNAVLDPNSHHYVEELVSLVRMRGANVNYKAYSSPVFIADHHAVVTSVAQWNCQGKLVGFPNKVLAEQWRSVPIPMGAVPAAGTDSEMTIYDRQNDVLWEFWRAQLSPDGKWSACWGGRIDQASESDGYFTDYFGATATGLAFIGGQITVEELLLGEINHVIGIALPDVSPEYYWPAQRSDGINNVQKNYQIPAGARFRLSADVDVDSLPLNYLGKTIARAAQRYGFVVWDRAHVVSVRAQGSSSYKFKGKPDIYEHLWQDQLASALKGFPWEKVEFLVLGHRHD